MSKINSGANDNKLLQIESVRGVAALSVIIAHFVVLYYDGVLSGAVEPVDSLAVGVKAVFRSPLAVVINGEFAVRVFFVLSGFVLSVKFFQGGTEDGVRMSVLKRLPRLGLPVWACLIVCYVLLANGLYFHRQFVAACPTTTEHAFAERFRFDHTPRSLAKEMGNIFFVQSGVDTYNSVLWTMEYEFKGSMLVYGLLLLIGRLKYRQVGYALVAAIFVKFRAVYYVDFLTGLLIADVYAAYASRWRRPAIGFAVATVGWATGSGCVWWQNTTGTDPLLAKLGFTVAAGLILWGVLTSPALRAVLRARLLVYLGAVSFSTYLLHIPVMFSVGMYCYMLAVSRGISTADATALSFAVSLTVTYLVATIFYGCIDRPATALATRLARAVFVRSEQTPACQVENPS